MVVVSDLVPDTLNIHPTLKKEVAARLSNLALFQTYNSRGQNPNSPSMESFSNEYNRIVIKLKDAPFGILAKGDAGAAFEIAGADKIFYPAQVRIEGSQITVYSGKVPYPIAVRYGFNNTTIPNLFSKTGLPVNLFRTDDWEMDTSEIK
jgi:sialate O-acetylesterase